VPNCRLRRGPSPNLGAFEDRIGQCLDIEPGAISMICAAILARGNVPRSTSLCKRGSALQLIYEDKGAKVSHAGPCQWRSFGGSAAARASRRRRPFHWLPQKWQVLALGGCPGNEPWPFSNGARTWLKSPKGFCVVAIPRQACPMDEMLRPNISPTEDRPKYPVNHKDGARCVAKPAPLRAGSVSQQRGTLADALAKSIAFCGSLP